MTSFARRDPVVHSPAETALAEAAAALERAEHDEQAATAARARYRASGQPPIAPGPDLLPHLAEGERLLAVRSTSLLEDGELGVAADAAAGSDAGTGGPLYLTSTRIMQLGRRPISIELGLVEELALAGERLLLTLRDGRGFVLDLPQPRLFRVEVAAALRSARG